MASVVNRRRQQNRRSLDLNADLGEGETTDLALLDVVTSCNVACGGHAGDSRSMRSTVLAAAQRAVAVGAHPGYPDREGFGRRSGFLPPNALRGPLRRQIGALVEIAAGLNVEVRHVKPHGALYNDAARDRELADAVCASLAGLDTSLLLVGPPASALEDAALDAGVGFVREGFVDRAYTTQGRLVPRNQPGAVLTGQAAVVAQALSIARESTVPGSDGEEIALEVDTLCIHGDTPGAVTLACAVRAALLAAGVRLQAFRHPGVLS